MTDDKRHSNKGRPLGSGHGNVRRYMTRTDVAAFMREARRTGRKADLAFALTFHFALRVSELAGLRLADFHLRNTADGQGARLCLTIRAAKGGETVEPPVPPFIISKYKAWLKERGADASPWLFPSTVDPHGHATEQSFKAAFYTVAKRAGIEARHSIHDLRHTCAQFYAQAGAPQVAVAGWLRHKDVGSAAEYLRGVVTDRQAADVAALTEGLLR